MKLIKPYFEIIEQDPGLEGIYKQIERAGRTCYHSSDKITEDSAKKFVDMLIKRGHTSCLEHGTIYLKIPIKAETFYEIDDYKNNPYTKTTIARDLSCYYISTNYRVLVEHNWLDDLKYICEPTEHHEKRITVKFICDRVTGESFLRHRAIDEDHPTIEGEVTREMEKDIDSFARESTRYCNYTKDKFNNQFTIITPPEFYEGPSYDSLSYFGDTDDKIFRNMCCSISAGEVEEDFDIFETWIFANLATQWAYNRLISLGWQAQQARRVIPLDIKSPLVMTAFISDWKHFFDLRCDKAAHPQAQELAIPLKEEFIKRGYITK